MIDAKITIKEFSESKMMMECELQIDGNKSELVHEQASLIATMVLQMCEQNTNIDEDDLMEEFQKTQIKSLKELKRSKKSINEDGTRVLETFSSSDDISKELIEGICKIIDPNSRVTKLQRELEEIGMTPDDEDFKDFERGLRRGVMKKW